MSESGRKATGCNCALRAINAYLHWSHAGAGCQMRPGLQTSSSCTAQRDRTLCCPRSPRNRFRQLATWKPKGTGKYKRRLRLLILFLLDTGCRISEALGLHVRDLDMENLLVTLDYGKGRKPPPFSFELRKAMVRYIMEGKKMLELSPCLREYSGRTRC